MLPLSRVVLNGSLVKFCKTTEFYTKSKILLTKSDYFCTWKAGWSFFFSSRVDFHGWYRFGRTVVTPRPCRQKKRRKKRKGWATVQYCCWLCSHCAKETLKWVASSAQNSAISSISSHGDDASWGWCRAMEALLLRQWRSSSRNLTWVVQKGKFRWKEIN